MKWILHLALAALMAVVTANSVAEATILKTVADAQVGETPGDQGSNGTSMNVRTFLTGNADRNELIALRFDLSSVDLNDYIGATLNLTWFRNESSQRYYRVWGVRSGAVGGDNNGQTPGFTDATWDETSVVMSTMPGLIYDGDPATQGINPADTTDLGGGQFSNATKGDLEVIDVPGLFSFLENHPTDQVTLILGRDLDLTPGSTGQDRFASKEAAALDGGSPSGSAGDFAPFLQLVPIPEPGSGALMVLFGVAMLARRRRG